MEFDLLSEQLKWQAKRVIVAFEVEEWETNPLKWKTTPRRKWPGIIRFQGFADSVLLDWGFGKETEALLFLAIGGLAGAHIASEVRFSDDRTAYCFPTEPYDQLMVRGLYRLGIGSHVLDQFNQPLTAHEKLELRHSLPREFWPPAWLYMA